MSPFMKRSELFVVSIKAAKDKVGCFPQIASCDHRHMRTHPYTHIYTCVLLLYSLSTLLDLQSMASRCSLPQLVDHGVSICLSPRVSRSQSSCVPPSSRDRRRHTENAPAEVPCGGMSPPSPALNQAAAFCPQWVEPGLGCPNGT